MRTVPGNWAHIGEVYDHETFKFRSAKLEQLVNGNFVATVFSRFYESLVWFQAGQWHNQVVKNRRHIITYSANDLLLVTAIANKENIPA